MSGADRSRRACLARLAAGASAFAPAAAVFGPGAARAQPAAGARELTLQEMIGPIVGAAVPVREGVRLQLPALADNGLLVPARVVVDSPMTVEHHVRRIVLLSSRNPVTRMAVFHLGPWSGRAEVGTRVRLAGTQRVVALAELSDGRFRLAEAEVVVTESACLDMG